MNVCPYCSGGLDRTPKRRTACPSCGKPILVRKKCLCTEEEARAVDWCSVLQIDAAEFQRTQEKLSAQFGRTASCGDTLWHLMHKLLERARSLQDRQMIYFQMPRFLWEEKKDYLEVGRQGVRMGLADWRKAASKGLLDLKEVRLKVSTAGEASCPECRALQGRLFTFEEAESGMLLPSADCSHEKTEDRVRGWCRCCYVLSFPD